MLLLCWMVVVVVNKLVGFASILLLYLQQQLVSLTVCLCVLRCVLQLSSVGLCPNTIGQVVVSVLCNPPKPGDPSYDLWQKERSDELASLRRRAHLVSSAFNSLPNMSVVPTEAAMYSFPQVRQEAAANMHVMFCAMCIIFPS